MIEILKTIDFIIGFRFIDEIGRGGYFSIRRIQTSVVRKISGDLLIFGRLMTDDAGLRLEIYLLISSNYHSSIVYSIWCHLERIGRVRLRSVGTRMHYIMYLFPLGEGWMGQNGGRLAPGCTI